jgi:hypothetical protein
MQTRIINRAKCDNASVVTPAGLKALEQGGRDGQAKLEAVRAAVLAGEESGIAAGDVISEARERVRICALTARRVRRGLERQRHRG